MTGGKKPKFIEPEPVSPAAMPIPGREEKEAKKKVRRGGKGRGREATILAGKMMTERETGLKDILG